MGQGVVNNRQCEEGVFNRTLIKLKGFFRMNKLKPVLLAWFWLIVILAVLGVNIFKLYGLQFCKDWDIVLILFLLFLLLIPLPLITFPLIIVSIMNNTRQRKTSIDCILYIDSRKIKITDIPSQHKIYCFRKSSYNVHLCYKGKLDSEIANLYEEKVCSLEIIVDD